MRNVLSSTLLSCALLASVAGGVIVAASPAIAQEANLRVLTVTGNGTESIATTRAQVTLGVEVQGKTAEAAQQEAARRSTAVVNLLRDRNVAKLQTTGIRLNPQYRYDQGVSELVGYTAANIVSFEMPVETVGPLLDEAVRAGATDIQGVSFIASEDAIANAQAAALRKATADARAQANAVLGSLNFQVEEIIGIQINGATPPAPMPMLREAPASSYGDASTPVVGGEQTITATVTLQIRY